MALTTRTLTAGQKYFNGHRIATVEEGTTVVLCEVCGDTFVFQNRLGSSSIADFRTRHIESTHAADLKMGRAVVA